MIEDYKLRAIFSLTVIPVLRSYWLDRPVCKGKLTISANANFSLDKQASANFSLDKRASA